jgi:hypothetical protein
MLKDLTVDTVTARISGFMKKQSITCSFYSNELRVNCLTEGLLRFVVQLWQGSSGADDKNNHKNVILHFNLSIQRSCQDADQASRVILSDGSFQTLLANYFVHMGLIHDQEPTTINIHEEGGDDDIAMGYEQGQFFGCLRFLTLHVLSHALESVAYHQQSSSRHRISSLSIEFSASFWQRVLQALY